LWYRDSTLDTICLISKISQKVTKKEKNSLIQAWKIKNEKIKNENEDYYLLW